MDLGNDARAESHLGADALDRLSQEGFPIWKKQVELRDLRRRYFLRRHLLRRRAAGHDKIKVLAHQRLVIETGHRAFAVEDSHIHAPLQHHLAEHDPRAVVDVRHDAGIAFTHLHQ